MWSHLDPAQAGREAIMEMLASADTKEEPMHLFCRPLSRSARRQALVRPVYASTPHYIARVEQSSRDTRHAGGYGRFRLGRYHHEVCRPGAAGGRDNIPPRTVCQ